MRFFRDVSQWSAGYEDRKLCPYLVRDHVEAETEEAEYQGKRWAGLPICPKRYMPYPTDWDFDLTTIFLIGHEDLRQDERVMQLFGLVNSLLAVDTASFKRHLHIQRYSIIPLAPNAGLLGWVQDSDTLHVLVRDYRESRKILLNIEYRLMLQVIPTPFLVWTEHSRSFVDGARLREPLSHAKGRGIRVCAR